MKNDLIQNDLMPEASVLLQQYHELREYVGLTQSDIQTVIAAWPLVEPDVAGHADDFYAEILRHKETRRVITGGSAQVDRLKGTLRGWIVDLFDGTYDEQFVRNRWNVGWRHVQIGLSQIWTAASMSRLRDQIIEKMTLRWEALQQDSTDVGEIDHQRVPSAVTLQKAISAISRLMDLDLALIQDAYYAQSVATHLQAEKDFAESIIGTTESIVMLVDEAGKILRGNNFLSRHVAGTKDLPEQIESISTFLPSDSYQEIVILLQQAESHSSGPVETILVDGLNRNRTVRWFAKRFEFHESRMTTPVANSFLLVGHDISDLTATQRALVRSERLAAIGQTMTGLAHESRNAFQRSQASLETLALEVSDRPEAVKLIERIQRAHDHLLHLYEEVLQFAKPVLLDLGTHRVKDLIRRTWSHLVEAGVAQQAASAFEPADDLQDIRCDPFAVEQILRNLMENALSVTPEGKVIEVTASQAWQGDCEAVRIRVRDYGPGIPSEYQSKIFEPFFSTRSRGTGLGLPIARRLAEAHGGSLELLSIDDGTIAEVILPRESKGDSVVDPEDRPDYRRASN